MLDLISGEIGETDARIVVQAAKQGDSLAQSIVREAVLSLACGIISLMHIFDPELVVIGGSLGQNLEEFMPIIESEVKDRAMAHFQGAFPVAMSQLGDDVSLLGAAALVFSSGKESP